MYTAGGMGDKGRGMMEEGGRRTRGVLGEKDGHGTRDKRQGMRDRV